MDVNFLESFYQKVIYNEFTVNSVLATKEGLKPIISKIDVMKSSDLSEELGDFLEEK